MAEPQKTILDDLKDAFNEVKKGATSVANDVIETVENTAANVEIKREELWKRHRVSDRLTGAALTAKFGLAGLKLAPITVPLAALYGFAKGPKIVEEHDKWLAKHKDRRATEEGAPPPAANDDSSSKAPTPKAPDGPQAR